MTKVKYSDDVARAKTARSPTAADPTKALVTCPKEQHSVDPGWDDEQAAGLLAEAMAGLDRSEELPSETGKLINDLVVMALLIDEIDGNWRSHFRITTLIARMKDRQDSIRPHVGTVVWMFRASLVAAVAAKAKPKKPVIATRRACLADLKKELGNLPVEDWIALFPVRPSDARPQESDKTAWAMNLDRWAEVLRQWEIKFEKGTAGPEVGKFSKSLDYYKSLQTILDKLEGEEEIANAYDAFFDVAVWEARFMKAEL